ncbi:hypothetical protein H2201_003120 [Coniosporium apollinis]|uniref:MYND-type domain-containing protein n=1 Tax=Coniosporium apollinis TaxID=61459 RepID=A0ABQ9NYE3_9PEZI|nr:hypothetical protein H2201_003120 [Coniosporium apollinis]
MASTAPADPPSSGSHACAHCGALAVFACPVCRDTPRLDDKVESKWYCDAYCQTADWPDHRPLCKKLIARRRLSRAADFVQSLWYIFKEESNDHRVVDITLKDSVYHVHGDVASPHRLDKSYRFPFPNKLMLDESVKQAVLAHTMCCHAFYHMHDTIVQLLKDLYDDVSEASVVVKNECKKRCVRSLIGGQVDEVDYRHHIMKVKLKSGEVYAIDITGAQYGFHRAMVPWAEYMSTIHGAQNYAFGTARDVIRERLRVRDLESLLERYNEETGLVFKTTLTEALWLAGGLSLPRLIRLPEPAFREKQTQILRHVQAGLHNATELSCPVTIRQLAVKHNYNLSAIMRQRGSRIIGIAS